MAICYRCKTTSFDDLLEPNNGSRYRLLCRNCSWECRKIDEQKEELALQLSSEDLIKAIGKGEIKIYHLPKPLLADYDIVMKCIYQYEGETIDDSIEGAIAYLFENEKRNLDLLKRIIKTEGLAWTYMYAPPQLQNDKELALCIIQQNPSDLNYMRWSSPSLKADKELVLRWVKSKKDLEYLSKELQADQDIIAAATRNDRQNNYHAPIDGNDITREFGLTPGKHIGDLLAKLKNAILDGQVKNDYEEAKKFIAKLID